MIEGGRDQRGGKNTDSEISGGQMEIETWNQRRTKTQRTAESDTAVVFKEQAQSLSCGNMAHK